MAGANLPAKKYQKTTPTVLRLSFECDGGSTQYIDIARALSAINRRFYRQGLYYYVNSVEVYNNETGVIDLHTVPDTWVTRNAWKRGFALFQKMNNMVDYPLSSVGRPAYHDFKVFLDSRHQSQNSKSSSMYGINADFEVVNPDDWTYSRFHSADDDHDTEAESDMFNVHMVGGHIGPSDNRETVGLIVSYASTRNTVEPDAPEDSGINVTDPLLNVFDFSSEEQINDIVTDLKYENDEPPYDQNLYVGEDMNHLQHVCRIGTEVGVGRVGRAAGFCAPFGLICVDPLTVLDGNGDVDQAQSITTSFRVVLNLAQGTYKGVYAERV